ncbi:MAG: winged helix-turn-helix transcriptional regulator [Acholeplasmatales bacterium]|nr:winged helix-turn-helix transcriptional regulator [Acholeplasmatales bacterium]
MQDDYFEKYKNEIKDMCEFFKILGDPTRLKILLLIDNNTTMCVNDIALKLNMTKSAVSHQLALLRQARLINSKKEGKEVYYTLADDHIKTVVETAFDHVTE